jgi:hypothetical protein
MRCMRQAREEESVFRKGVLASFQSSVFSDQLLNTDD